MDYEDDFDEEDLQVEYNPFEHYREVKGLIKELSSIQRVLTQAADHIEYIKGELSKLDTETVSPDDLEMFGKDVSYFIEEAEVGHLLEMTTQLEFRFESLFEE